MFKSHLNREGLLVLGLILLVVPVFCWQLGLMPFLADEATRASVAIEMMLSGDYLLPTIGGEPYYNKPPLFNWIVVAAFKAIPSSPEFSLRLLAVISLFALAYLVYHYFSKFYKKRIAILASLSMLVIARVLFYDSLLGHIDLLYAALTFWGFMLMYQYSQRENYTAFFIVSYVFCAVGFLLKGLPSLLFQALAVLYFLYTMKQLHRIFSIKHFIGIFCFLILLAAYYWPLSTRVSLDTYLQTLMTESSKRTLTSRGVLEYLGYITQFPFEHLFFHLFPIGFFSIFWINKEVRLRLMENSFLKFSFHFLILQIVIYWISPETRPRYLFMLYPFAIVLLLASYNIAESLKLRTYFVLKQGFRVLFVMLSFAATIGIFFFDRSIHSYLFFSFSVMVISIIVSTWFFVRAKNSFLLLMMLVLLVYKGYFQLYILPERQMAASETKYKKQMMDFAKASKGKELLVHSNVYFKHAEQFYLNYYRQDIPARVDTNVYSDALTLVDYENSIPRNYCIADTMRLQFSNQLVFILQRR